MRNTTQGWLGLALGLSACGSIDAPPPTLGSESLHTLAPRYEDRALRPLLAAVMHSTQAHAGAAWRIQSVVGGDSWAPNPEHRFSTRFGALGPVVQADGAPPLRLELRGQPAAHLGVDQNRATYDHGVLTSWFLNGPLGLEQGFVIDAPLPGQHADELRLDLESSWEVAPDGDGLMLSAGTRRLRYDYLSAVDARGRELPAQLLVSDGGFTIAVDTTSAMWPVLVDPLLTEESRPPAVTLGEGARYGAAVDAHLDTIAIGAPGLTTDAGRNGGAVWLFRNKGSGWQERGFLTASAPGAQCGSSVAVGVGRALVGCPTDNSSPGAGGSVRVYEEQAGVWTEVATVTANDASPGASFGTSVDLDGDTAVIGAPNAGGTGVAYAEAFLGGTWVEQGRLVPVGATPGAQVGYDVAVSGDTVLVGAPNFDGSRGAAVVFQRSGVTWNEHAQLQPPGLAPGANLGLSVALQGDRAAAGSPGMGGGPPGSGSVQLFERALTDWTHTTELTGTVAGGRMGTSVAVDGDFVISGAPQDSTAGGSAGSASVYALTVTGWSEAQTLRSSQPVSAATFGQAVGLSQRLSIVGAPGEADGAAYLYTLDTAPQVDLSQEVAGLDLSLTLPPTGPGAVVAADAVVSDWDSRQLAALHATLVDAPDGTAETLSASLAAPELSQSWDPGTRQLSIVGLASEQAYVDALRTLSYSNGAPSPTLAQRRVEVVVSDGLADSVVAVATLTPTDLNAPPALDLSGWGVGTDFHASLSTSRMTLAAVHRGATLTDADNSLLTGLRATLSPAPDPEERLKLTTQNPAFTVDWAGGVLTVSGTATTQAYQELLRTLTYENKAVAPTPGTRTILVEAFDGTAWGGATSTLNWADSQVAPTVGLSQVDANVAADFVEDGGPVSCARSDAWLQDVDNTELASLTATLDVTWDGASEVLAADVQGTDLQAAYNTTTRTLTLTGPDTPARFAQALATITYDNASNDPNTSTRFVRVRASDGVAQSAPATCTLSVTPANDAPWVDLNGGVAPGSDFAIEFTEDAVPEPISAPSSLIGDVDDTLLASATIQITNAVDVNTEALGYDTSGTSIQGVFTPGTSTLTLTGPDTVANFQAVLHTVTYGHTNQTQLGSSRTIRVVVDDGKAVSAPATTTVTLRATNDAPILRPSTGKITWTEDGGPVVVDDALFFVDRDFGPLGGGQLVVESAGAEPEDVLAFLDQGSASGQVGFNGTEVSWQGLPIATVSGGAGDVPLVLDVLDVARVTSLGAALKALTFHHSTDRPSSAPRTLTYTYTDAEGASSSPVEVVVEVVPVNDPPVFVPPTPTGSLAIQEGRELNIALVARDPDSALTYSVTPTPLGSAVDTLNGAFRWTPDFSQVGVWDLTIRATDGELVAERPLSVEVLARDTDGDGVPDGLEQSLGLDPLHTDSDGDTIPDGIEVGDLASPRDTDGDGLCDAIDEDSDGDGLLDADEAGDDDLDTPPVDTDDDGLYDAIDEDSDADGHGDRDDHCPTVADPGQEDLDGDAIGDLCDEDADGDGILNEDELFFGLDPMSIDSDGDTISDRDEGTRDTDNDGIPDALDTDSDFDSIPDAEEAGDTDLGTPPVDTDGDERPDFRDSDSDSDGIPDNADNCRIVHNPDQSDVDGNGEGDPCDRDSDGDGVLNFEDVCPLIVDDQTDTDFDGRGDVCDSDMDADLIPNDVDNCPLTVNTDQIDRDHDGIGDACDPEVTCGCGSTPHSGWPALLFLPLIWRRRQTWSI